MASLHCKESGGSVLKKENDEDENHHLSIDGSEAWFQQFIERPNPQGGDNGAGQFSHSSGHHHHKRVHNVIPTKLGIDVAHQG